MPNITKAKIPNLLSLLRVLMILPMMVSWFVFSRETTYWITFVLFSIAAATDFLDGYLARKWNVGTELGAMLDQITDKLVVATVLLFLVFDRSVGIIPALLLLLREIYVSGLREYLALKHIALPVSKIGKWKTMIQMVAILVVLAGMCFQVAPMVLGGNVLLIIAAFLALWSAYQYSRRIL